MWSFGERKFGGDIRWRLKLFDSLVKSILMFGVEIWGYKEWKEVESLQKRYIRWILELSRNTPGYIVRDEVNKGKVRIETGKGAGKFEEKLGKGEISDIGRECWRERKEDEKERKNKEWARESMERRGYPHLWRCGVSEEALEELGENGCNEVGMDAKQG